MQFVMIFSLIIAVLSVMFSMQNTATVSLKFFIWTFESPLALLLIIAVTVGAIITSILTLPGWFRHKKSSSHHKKEMVDLEENLAKYRTDLIDTQNKNKDLRQKILEVEEARESLEKAHLKTEQEISDLKTALSDAELTAEQAEAARQEALQARDEMDAALKEMDLRLAENKFHSDLSTDEPFNRENADTDIPSDINHLPDSFLNAVWLLYKSPSLLRSIKTFYIKHAQ